MWFLHFLKNILYSQDKYLVNWTGLHNLNFFILLIYNTFILYMKMNKFEKYEKNVFAYQKVTKNHNFYNFSKVQNKKNTPPKKWINPVKFFIFLNVFVKKEV